MTPETEMGSLDLALPPQDKEKQLSKSNAQAQQPLPCPRCDSLSTKFCYFNNYNLAQPRHYCRSCKRYWTHGGALRNVPVGGSSRKSYSSSSSSSSKRHAIAHRAATLPPRKPDVERSNVVDSGMNVTSSGLILGFGPFGFELIPGFDALQGFGFGHAGNTTTAFWAYPEIANNVMTASAATASCSVSGGGGGGGGGASPVNSFGIDRWRLEDALVQDGNYEEFLACPDLCWSWASLF